MTNKTLVQINRSEKQTTTEIKKALSKIGVSVDTNEFNELLVNVPRAGLGVSLNENRAAVNPAAVRMFDSYIIDGTEERHYY